MADRKSIFSGYGKGRSVVSWLLGTISWQDYGISTISVVCGGGSASRCWCSSMSVSLMWSGLGACDLRLVETIFTLGSERVKNGQRSKLSVGPVIGLILRTKIYTFML